MFLPLILFRSDLNFFNIIYHVFSLNAAQSQKNDKSFLTKNKCNSSNCTNIVGRCKYCKQLKKYSYIK